MTPGRAAARGRRLLPLALAAALAAAGCQDPMSWASGLENGDYSSIHFCRPPAVLQPVAPEGDLEKFVARACAHFAERQHLLHSIAGQCPSIERSSLGQFRFAGVLAGPAGAVLRFFAPYEDPRLFAGRRIEFLLDGAYQLEGVYVSDAPLEQ